MSETLAVRVRISGLVQGVAYRAWTERQASALRLSGWVRNTRSGHVEAVFSGPEGAVDTMLAACREGPRGAQVENVEILGWPDPVSGPFTIRFDQ